MRRLVVLLACLALLVPAGVNAGGGHGGGGGSGSHSSGSGSHSSGSVHVGGYTQKDGTYVAPYTRNPPGHGEQSSSGGLPHSSLSSGHTSHSSSSGFTARSLGAGSRHYATSAVGARDSHGRLVRSEAAKHDFMKETGYPHGRPGYVVDHIVPLKRGGCDCPSNMQWQTVADAKAKDKWE
jgi:hypothetical protein